MKKLFSILLLCISTHMFADIGMNMAQCSNEKNIFHRKVREQAKQKFQEEWQVSEKNISLPKKARIELSNKEFSKGTVILIHGLSEFPKGVEYLGSLYKENGYDVLFVRLKGHGEKNTDVLEKLDYHDWVSDVDKAIKFAKEHWGESIKLAGFSLGGLLAIKKASEENLSVDAFSPTIAVKDSFKKYIERIKDEQYTSPIADTEEKFKDPFTPVNAVKEVIKLEESFKEQLHKNPTPLRLRLVLSESDKFISSSAVIEYFKSLALDFDLHLMSKTMDGKPITHNDVIRPHHVFEADDEGLNEYSHFVQASP